MEPDYLRFVSVIVDTLTGHEIRYAIGGSLASSVYGEIRTTYDVDVSIELSLDKAVPFVDTFEKMGWYVFVQGVQEAIRRGGHFNIIEGMTALKADFFVLAPVPTPRQLRTLQRAREMPYGYGEKTARLMSPEDVILYKLEWYLMGKSEKHLRDIRAMLISLPLQIDYAYIDQWVDEIAAREVWQRLKLDQ